MKDFTLLPALFQVGVQDSPWAGFWKEFFLGVLAAIVVPVLGWLLLRARRAIGNLLRTRSRYRITGIWIGTCKLHRHGPGIEAVEIYRLVTKKEHLKLTFFHYLPGISDVRKYEGAGIYRGMVLSAFYYIPEPQCSESGVFVMRNVGEKFKGIYAQYDLVADMKIFISDEDFVLSRVHISPWAQLKMMLGRPPFPCHQQARALYDATVRAEPDRDALQVKPSQKNPEGTV